MAGIRIETNGEALMTATKLRMAASTIELSNKLQARAMEQQKHAQGAVPYIAMNLRCCHE